MAITARSTVAAVAASTRRSTDSPELRAGASPSAFAAPHRQARAVAAQSPNASARRAAAVATKAGAAAAAWLVGFEREGAGSARASRAGYQLSVPGKARRLAPG